MSGKALASDSESDDDKVDDVERGAESGSEDAKPAKKKMKPTTSGKAAKDEDSDSDADSVDSECVDDLSGDEVDASNIIEGGRRARRGRPTTFTAAMYAAAPLGSDSDDE